MPKYKSTMLGVSGLSYSSGMITEEFLTSLKSTKFFKTIKEMTYNDAIVAACLLAIKSLLKRAEWSTKAADDSNESMKLADLVSSSLNDMRKPWQNVLDDCYSCLEYGNSVMEKTFKKRQGEKNDPMVSSRYDDGLIGWSGWNIRAHNSISKWNLDKYGFLVSVEQTAVTGARATIPAQRLVHLVIRGEYDNPAGISLLRSAYRGWYIKKHLEDVEAIGCERDLVGLPVAEVPERIMATNASADEKAILDAYKNIIVNVRNDEQQGLILPRKFDAKGNNEYSFKLMGSEGKKQFDLDAVIKRWDQRIAFAFLADFLLLGHERVGSYALSGNKMHLFSIAMETLLGVVADNVNQVQIPELMRFNGFMDSSKYPTIKSGVVDVPNLAELGKFISDLSGVGIRFDNDPEFENYIRKMMRAPERARGEQADRESEQPAPKQRAEEESTQPEEELDDDE